MKPFLSFTLLPLLLLACNTDKYKILNCGDPATQMFQLLLLDKEDSILIGRAYCPDSIRLFSSSEALPLESHEGMLLVYFIPASSYKNKDLYLYLNKEDTDTLHLFFRTVSTSCWSFERMDSLQYNGENYILVNGMILRIYKPYSLTCHEKY